MDNMIRVELPYLSIKCEGFVRSKNPKKGIEYFYEILGYDEKNRPCSQLYVGQVSIRRQKQNPEIKTLEARNVRGKIEKDTLVLLDLEIISCERGWPP